MKQCCGWLQFHHCFQVSMLRPVLLDNARAALLIDTVEMAVATVFWWLAMPSGAQKASAGMSEWLPSRYAMRCLD
jgi:F0F1-type ATP synthase assembly protein I